MNFLSHFSHMPISRRVPLLAIGILALVLATISLVMSTVAEKGSRDRIVLWVGDKTQSIANSIDAFDATARLMTDRAYKPFRKKFAENFELDAEGGQLKSWGSQLNGDTAEVDAFNLANGGVATIFMRKGDDFERITTSLKKENGERAVGTLLARTHPAYQLMLNGGQYTGRAVLFGTPYMTHYEAVKDAGGKVVGILFIGFDITDFQASLQKMVDETRFFDSGLAMVIDPRQDNAEAVFVVHPNAAGKKVLEVQPDAGPMLTEMREGAEVWVQHASPLLGQPQVAPWAVKRQAQAGGWWVVSQVSDREAMAKHWNTMYAFWGLLAGATLLVGMGLFWLIRRTISRPLGDLTEAVTALAQGDLSREFRTDRADEIGVLVGEVERMRGQFQSIMVNVRSATDSINTASSEIASGNQDLSARTEQAASNLEETAASMEELTSTVSQSADAARQANQLAASASEVAVRGGQVVSQVVTTMEEINHSSKKISDIIGVIDGIAFQTNILALNAAVEAARAGEQGRGFAVVASEVRSLAQRSAEAAKEIKGLIGTSVDKVDAGSRLVAQAGQTMSEIVGSVQRVSDIIGEITAASGEQRDGIAQVNTAVNQLDQMTQQNAALVEESAAAAESLKDQAIKLAQVVQVFRLGSASNGSVAHLAAPEKMPATPFRTERKSIPSDASKSIPRSMTVASIQPAKAVGHTTSKPSKSVAAPLRPNVPSLPSKPIAAPKVPAKSGDEGDWESF